VARCNIWPKALDFSSIWSNETGIEVNFQLQENRNIANDLQAEHQTGAVISFREYRAERTDFW